MQSETESMIAASVESIFGAEVTPQLIERSETGVWAEDFWSVVEKNGLPLALCAPAAGGSGFSWREILPVLKGIGRWCVPLPLAETMAANWLLERAGLTPQAGPVTLADDVGGGGAATPRLLQTEGGLCVLGEIKDVAWFGDCRWLVTQVLDAETGEHALGLVDLQQLGVSVIAGRNYAGEPRGRIRFKHAPCVIGNRSSELESRALPFLVGALMRSAMICGALDAALDQTIAYVNERIQFGKPLSKNQVIQQNLAKLAAEVQAAHMATQVAMQTLSENALSKTLAFDVAVSKIKTATAASHAFAILHQAQGTIGFTREHSLHHFTRRLLSWRQEFGGESYWSSLVGRAAMQRGGHGFWPSLSSRSFDITSNLLP